MPLAKDGQLEDQAPALQIGVEAAAESVAVDVEEQLGGPRGVLRGGLDDGEELALGVAVARVALADVGEGDVDEGFVVCFLDLLQLPAGVGGGGAGEDFGGVEAVHLLHAALPVLAPPAAVAGEAAGGGAAPVEGVFFGGPGHVGGFVVADFAVPVPGAGVEDVLEGAQFALREDGEEVVHDAEGVGAVEEAVCFLEGR